MSITIGGSILNGDLAVEAAERIVRDCATTFEVRTVNEEAGELEAVISTREVDRYRSIILPRGFDRLLPHFRANPMFLWMHNRNAPLGTVKKIWRDNDRVYAIFSFDLENRFAAEVFRLYKKGVMRAFSVAGSAAQIFYSWMSHREREQLRELDEQAWQALEDEEAYYVISELELYEVSAVTVPGNRGALKRAFETGEIDQEFADQFGFGRDAHEEDHERKETPMDRIPKELVQRMDDITAAANALVEQRKAEDAARAAAPAELNEKQLEQVRQCVLDTLASVYAAE